MGNEMVLVRATPSAAPPPRVQAIPAPPRPQVKPSSPRSAPAPKLGKAQKNSFQPHKGTPGGGSSIFGKQEGAFVPHVELSGAQPRAAAPEVTTVYAKPVLGQTAPVAELYPAIDRIIKSPAVPTMLPRAQANVLFQALTDTLVGISSAANAHVPCVIALSPSVIATATAFRNRLAPYIAGTAPEDFADYSVDELAASDQVLACYGALATDQSNVSAIVLGVALFAGAGLFAYWMMSGK